MTQLQGIQYSIGTLLLGAKVRFTSDLGPKVKGNFGGTIANPPPATVFLTAHLPALGLTNFPKWTVGLGVTCPSLITARASPRKLRPTFFNPFIRHTECPKSAHKG